MVLFQKQKNRNLSSKNSSLLVLVIDECVSTRLCDDLSVNASTLLQSRKTPLEEVNNPDDDVVNPKRRKTRNLSFENSYLSVAVMDECMCARLCDDSSANTFNFVQSRKWPMEDKSSPDDDSVIPKSKKTSNLSSDNSSHG